MTPAARVQAAIEILGAYETESKPADRFLRDSFRTRRYAGSKDRAEIAERVYAVFRRRASLEWRMNSDAPRSLVIASLLEAGISLPEMEAMFNGTGYAPEPLGPDEKHALRAHRRETPPVHVRGEFPAFLEGELRREFGERLIDEMLAFVERAPVDLRVNTLKTTREAVLAGLEEDGLAACATPYARAGIRVAPSRAAGGLNRHPMYEEGLFDFQDEGAQISSSLCCARPGMRVLDLAAGAGGKSLALAADMQDEGEIIACDIRPGALRELALRANRAGVSIIRICPEGLPEGEFDLVLVDAPCSGSGTWRRQPEQKWRLTPERLADLLQVQDTLLSSGASRVGPNGRLAYVTCSILPSENEDRVVGFLERRSGFVLRPVRSLADRAGVELGESNEFLKLSPLRTGTDGFFAAVLERAS
jgi:16S rRNA (cytosine967-C5)-methyltransferase